MAPKKAAAAAPVEAPAAPAAPVDPGPETDVRRLRFREAFKVFDPENTGNVQSADIPTLLRYLNIFVPDNVWRESLEADILNGQTAPYVEQKHLENKVIALYDQHAHEPDGPATLYAAFRALDKENKGWIDVKTMKSLLASSGGMTEEEVNALIHVAAPKFFEPPPPDAAGSRAGGAGKGKGEVKEEKEGGELPEKQRLYYSDYIALMTRFR